MPPSASLPVTVDLALAEVARGTFSIVGTVSLEEQGEEAALCFTYEERGRRGAPRAQRTLRVPLADVQDATLTARRLVVRPRRRDLLEHMPGTDTNAFVFKVDLADRARAQAFVARLRSALPPGRPPSIPFSLAADGFGLTEAKGFLYLEADFLVFDVGTGLPGGAEKEQRIVKVEPAALAEVRLDRGLLRDTLYVRPKRPDLLEALPGRHAEALKLHVQRRHRAEAEQLVYAVQQRRPA